MRPAAAVLACFVAYSVTARADEPAHRLAVFSKLGGGLFLAQTRTMGGLGAGVGLRDTVDERFLLQAELSYLAVLGHVGELRLGAGVQRRGFWSPAVLATTSVMFGDRLEFRVAGRPTPTGAPVATLGLSVAPLRFCVERGRCVSMLELGLAAGTEFTSAGTALQLGLLDVSFGL